MVPALYADDEKESVVGTVREEALAAGLQLRCLRN